MTCLFQAEPAVQLKLTPEQSAHAACSPAASAAEKRQCGVRLSLWPQASHCFGFKTRAVPRQPRLSLLFTVHAVDAEGGLGGAFL